MVDPFFGSVEEAERYLENLLMYTAVNGMRTWCCGSRGIGRGVGGNRGPDGAVRARPVVMQPSEKSSGLTTWERRLLGRSGRSTTSAGLSTGTGSTPPTPVTRTEVFHTACRSPTRTAARSTERWSTSHTSTSKQPMPWPERTTAFSQTTGDAATSTILKI